MPTEEEDSLTIKGTTGVAISNALYMYFGIVCYFHVFRYMKYFCNSTLSWGEDGTGDNIVIPTPLPRVTKEWTEEVFPVFF